MKEDTKQCIKWMVIGALWLAAVAVAAFVISILGG